MIYLLGGSGYVGGAYQALLRKKASPSATSSAREIDYAAPGVLLAALRAGPAGVPDQRGRATPANPTSTPAKCTRRNACIGNAVLPGLIARACAEAGVPWGHVSSGCIFSGAAARRQRLHRGGHAQFHVSHQSLLVLQRHQGPGRGGARGRAEPVCLAPADSVRPGRQSPQLPDQADALPAAPRGDQLGLPAP